MKKEVKNLYFAVVLGFIFIFLIGLVSATSHTHTCPNSNGIMIKLAQSSNSLGALASDPNYAWQICYDEIFGQTAGSGSNTCNGNNDILWLSGNSNAHASSSQDSGHNVEICFGDLSCVVDISSGVSCPSDWSLVLRMSGQTNAHLADASYTPYPYKLCCGTGALPETCPTDSFTCSDGTQVFRENYPDCTFATCPVGGTCATDLFTCPDGTQVSRVSPPQCDFEACPASTCTEAWTCTSWSSCVDDVQTRTCTDTNSCGTTANKPNENGVCIVGGGSPGDGICDDPNNIIMRLGQDINSLGAIASDTNYAWEICYDDIFGQNAGSGSNTCDGNNNILWLSGNSNAHASSSSDSTYNVPVCFGDLSCVVDFSSGSSCFDPTQSVVLRMSSLTNAHLAVESFTPYTNKICCGTSSCTEVWECTSWSSCNSGVRTRTCTDDGGCGIPANTPPLAESCGVTESFARWENTMGGLITNAEVGDTVILVLRNSSLPEGSNVNFMIREQDTFGDDNIGTFGGTIEGGNATAIWIIDEADLDNTPDDYDRFYFEVDGVRSGYLDISPIPENTPFNLSVESPDCGQWFFKDTPHLIEIVAEDVDDVIDGILRITSVNVDGTISVDVERSFTNGGLGFVYEFPKHGNLGISVSGSSRGSNLAKSSNVMVINENISEFYLAACIDEPENLAHLISNQVEFNASSTIGYVWKPIGCNHPNIADSCAGGICLPRILNKSAFDFFWSFSEGDSYGPGSGSDYWNFNHTFNAAGNNSATLSVNINSLVVDTLGGCGSS